MGLTGNLKSGLLISLLLLFSATAHSTVWLYRYTGVEMTPDWGAATGGRIEATFRTKDLSGEIAPSSLAWSDIDSWEVTDGDLISLYTPDNSSLNNGFSLTLDDSWHFLIQGNDPAGQIHAHSNSSDLSSVYSAGQNSGSSGTGTWSVTAADGGNCDDINKLVGYGVIGERYFQYGNNNKINGNSISGSGNSLPPEGACETTDLDFPTIDPETFPGTGNTDLKPPSGPVPAGKYKTIEFEAKGKKDTLTFSGGDYYIYELSAKKGATIQFAPGNYYIEKISFDNKSEITTSPSGQVNIYIKETFQAGNQCSFNLSDDTQDFVIYLYDYAVLQLGNANGGSGTDFNGIIYSPGFYSTIQLGNDHSITGAIISAGGVSVGNNTTFDYTPGVKSKVLDTFGCADAAGPDHFRIDHPGSALTCQSAPVTVRACADADCNTLYSDDVDIDLSPSGWVGGDSQVLSGGSGTFRLRHTTPGSITLSVSSQNPAAKSAPQCVDGSGGASCELTFHEAGFLFDVPDLTACSLEQNIPIAAVRADATGEQCIGDGSFADTARSVNFWSGYQDPATGTRSVYVNGNAISSATPGTAVQLSFDAQAESLLRISYADAGRIGLSARFEGSGDEAGLVMIGTDSFVATPHHLRAEATTDGTMPLDNATSASDPHWPAGEDFTVEVSGVCSDDSVTPNFAATTILSAIAADPAAGVFSGGQLTGSDYSGGTATATAAYSEVGTVTLQAEASDYLGSGIDIVGTMDVGRFTPYRFDVSLNEPQFAPACAVGGFTYLGQSFTYATSPMIDISARNKSGAVTANYTQGWWKITGASLTGKTYSAATGTLDLTAIAAGDPVVSDLGGGYGRLTFGDGGGIHFVRNAAPKAPFDAEISLAINVLDADGIAATANPVTFGTATAGNGIPFAGSGKSMRWGRLAFRNAYGSERVPLPMPYRAEFYNGSAFVTNPLDSCTGTALGLLSLGNDSGTVTADNPIPVGSGSSIASLSNPFIAGDAGLQFSAPGSEGYIHVQVDLSSLAWLRYDWNGDGIQDDPSARATFGIYKGRTSLIYFRETYR